MVPTCTFKPLKSSKVKNQHKDNYLETFYRRSACSLACPLGNQHLHDSPPPKRTSRLHRSRLRFCSHPKRQQLPTEKHVNRLNGNRVGKRILRYSIGVNRRKQHLPQPRNIHLDPRRFGLRQKQHQNRRQRSNRRGQRPRNNHLWR